MVLIFYLDYNIIIVKVKDGQSQVDILRGSGVRGVRNGIQRLLQNTRSR